MQTTHLALPLIDAAQAQKHVTHNESLALLDALAHLAVSARGVAFPPASPIEGERLLIGADAAGAFAGKSGLIATFLAGAWSFLTPRPGWRLYVTAESLLLLYDGANWVDLGSSLRTKKPRPIRRRSSTRMLIPAAPRWDSRATIISA